MKFLINGHDTEGYFSIASLSSVDNAGGFADSLEVKIIFDEKSTTNLMPQNGDVVQAVNGFFNTGIMYVDEVKQSQNFYIAKALSTPLESKVPRTQGWRDVGFFDLAQEIADKYSYGVGFYGIENHRYKRVKQDKITDFEFLRKRCLLEGYTLKIYNKKIIIYNNKALQNEVAQQTIEIDGEHSLTSSSEFYFDGAEIVMMDLKARHMQGTGNKILHIDDVPIYSIAQGERFCRGFINANNQKIKKLKFSSEIIMMAGSKIAVIGKGLLQGEYIIGKVVFDFIKGVFDVEAGGI